MSGFINISRELVNHPLVGIRKPKYHAAWTWMLTQARWKPGRVMVGANMVELKRGQLCHSYRFMADQLPLSVQEIRTLLKHLKNQHMIQHKTNTGQNLITICNYDKYQSAGIPSNTQSTQQSTQEQHRSNTKKKKDERRMKEYVAVDAREAMPVLDRCCEIIGVSYETDPRWLDVHTVIGWMRDGADPETDIFPTVTRLVGTATKRINSLGYFTGAIADAKATRERPLPEGRPAPGQRESPHRQMFRVAEKLYNELVEEEDHAGNHGTQGGNVKLIGTATGSSD